MGVYILRLLTSFFLSKTLQASSFRKVPWMASKVWKPMLSLKFFLFTLINQIPSYYFGWVTWQNLVIKKQYWPNYTLLHSAKGSQNTFLFLKTELGYSIWPWSFKIHWILKVENTRIIRQLHHTLCGIHR